MMENVYHRIDLTLFVVLGILSFVMPRKFPNDRHCGIIQLKVLPDDAHHDFIPRFDFGEPRI